MPRSVSDPRFSFESHYAACETIDACLLSGDPDEREMRALEEYMARWQRSIAAHRARNAELAAERAAAKAKQAAKAQ